VLAAWGALAAEKDPSACLLTHPGFVYSFVRQDIAESCADMITAGFPVTQIGESAKATLPAEYAQAAATADLVKEVPDRADPSESKALFRNELANGRTIKFGLETDDGEWAVATSGVSWHSKPGEPLVP
jgi:hypothetical protein